MGEREPEDGALFRKLFEATSDGILIVDAAGEIVFGNPAAAGLLGIPQESLRGRDVEEFVPARFRSHDDRRSEFAARPRLTGQGLELFVRRADGHQIPVDIALTPLTRGDGALVACTIRDLRGHVEAGESLRLQATALRSAANGVVITDRDGVVTWANPAACAITGYSPEELIGRHTRILKSGRHSPEFYANLWATIMRGETWFGRMVNRRKDGREYYEEQTIAPVVDDEGAITHFIAIKQDVTEQHRVQEALASANEALAAKVREIEYLNGRLREQALRDPLTALYNRRYLDETIGREVTHVHRAGLPLSIAVLDVDGFKRVNDTYGHAVGDQVLQRAADVLRENVRGSDLICRSGGDEFIVVMPGATFDTAVARAELWRASFAARPVPVRNGVGVAYTLSIGVALHDSQRESFEACLHRADTALLAAKRAGRDRVVAAERSPV